MIVKKNTAALSLDDDAKLGDLMKRLSTEHGIETAKQLGLVSCKNSFFKTNANMSHEFKELVNTGVFGCFWL